MHIHNSPLGSTLGAATLRLFVHPLHPRAMACPVLSQISAAATLLETLRSNPTSRQRCSKQQADKIIANIEKKKMADTELAEVMAKVVEAEFED